MATFQGIAQSLRTAVNEALPHLRRISGEKAAQRWRGEGTWSAKEIVGHLIDSAANNHQRFVRAAIDGSYEGPGYAQEQWVAFGGYASMEWESLLSLWEGYNQLLANVLERIPDERAGAAMRIKGESMTLQFVAEDYVAHLRGHLAQILTAGSGSRPR
jgi:hypothetical protein